MFSELNKDQLDKLASLCFDLAKIAFGFAFFPAAESMSHILESLVKVFISALMGLAFTYRGLIFLKRKEEI